MLADSNRCVHRNAAHCCYAAAVLSLRWAAFQAAHGPHRAPLCRGVLQLRFLELTAGGRRFTIGGCVGRSTLVDNGRTAAARTWGLDASRRG